MKYKGKLHITSRARSVGSSEDKRNYVIRQLNIDQSMMNFAGLQKERDAEPEYKRRPASKNKSPRKKYRLRRGSSWATWQLMGRWGNGQYLFDAPTYQLMKNIDHLEGGGYQSELLI